MIASVGEKRPDGLVRVGERFLLSVACGDNFGKRRDQHGKATVLLRLKNDREAEAFKVLPNIAPATKYSSSTGAASAQDRK